MDGWSIAAAWVQAIFSVLAVVAAIFIAREDGQVRKAEAADAKAEEKQQRIIYYKIARDIYSDVVSQMREARDMLQAGHYGEFLAMDPLARLSANAAILEHIMLVRLPGTAAAKHVQIMRRYSRSAYSEMHRARTHMESDMFEHAKRIFETIYPQLAELDRLKTTDEGPIVGPDTEFILKRGLHQFANLSTGGAQVRPAQE